MFTFLSAKPIIDTYHQRINRGIMSPRPTSTLLIAVLSGVLFLTGCQQPAETQPVPDDSQAKEKTAMEDSQPMQKSDSAAARIEQFQPLYVAQAQGLQRRLQAEYESLQAADTSELQQSLLLDGTANAEGSTDNANNAGDSVTNKNTNNPSQADDTPAVAKTPIPLAVPASSETGTITTETNTNNDTNSTINTEAQTETEEDINTSTEVGERDLTVLKRISLEPRKPIILTEDQIIERYQQAMDALYQPVTTPLNAEDTNTLINIATLVPQLFEHAEIAGRLNAKSPALARLIIQHQVWEQIEAQQVLDIQQMKRNQQQEFEQLMSKFNDTIKDYDEQIAKYEQTLKAFQ